MLETLKPVARTSISENIVEQITTLISRGALKPGERIPSEKELCRQFGVGRTSVREALRSLCVMGLLQTHAGDGTFVAQSTARCLERSLQLGLLLDRKMVEELVETRTMLESQTAALAAARAGAEDVEAMERNLRGMAESLRDPERYLEFDLRFHLAVARASQNSILASLLGTIRGYLQEWIKQTLTAPTRHRSAERASLSVAEHEKVLAAIRRRKPDQARRAMAAHIRSSSADLPLPRRGQAKDGG
jgi:GntR family transcriptional repressor for pyruvate dehydrogenase complex